MFQRFANKGAGKSKSKYIIPSCNCELRPSFPLD